MNVHVTIFNYIINNELKNNINTYFTLIGYGYSTSTCTSMFAFISYPSIYIDFVLENLTVYFNVTCLS